MIATAFILVLLGIVIKHGKMYFLIAGYNTMSDDKKVKIDIEGIATLMRNVFFGMALIILMGYVIAKFWALPNIESFSLYASVLIGIPYLLVKSNTNQYKKDTN